MELFQDSVHNFGTLHCVEPSTSKQMYVKRAKVKKHVEKATD